MQAQVLFFKRSIFFEEKSYLQSVCFCALAVLLVSVWMCAVCACGWDFTQLEGQQNAVARKQVALWEKKAEMAKDPSLPPVSLFISVETYSHF